MKSLLLPIIFILCFLPFSIKCQEANNFIKLVFKPDPSVFRDSYLFESFKHWSNQLNIKSFEIESDRDTDSYHEFTINIKNNYNLESRIIVLADKTLHPKVTEIRKEILRDSSETKSQNYALEFVEQFVWYYEIGKNDYLKDFLFPSYIKMLYDKERNKYKIIEKLRSNYKNSLPINSISWEVHEPYLLLSLELGSYLELLEINLDFKKYLTALHYNRLNLRDRVASLKDSINVWKSRPKRESKENKIEINAHTSKQAIDIFIKSKFKYYDTAVLTQSDSTQTIQVLWPYEVVTSNKVAQYFIKATPSHDESFYIDVDWIPQKMSFPNNINNSQELSNTINELYYNLLFPDFDLKWKHHYYQTKTAKFLLKYNSYDSEVVELKNYYEFEAVFREFSYYRPKFVQLRNVVSKQDSLQIDFYIIWKEQYLHIQHYASVSYIFNIQELNLLLDQTIVELFPFVRSENVLAILPDSSINSSSRNIIILRR